jgi:hypothetical protein
MRCRHQQNEFSILAQDACIAGRPISLNQLLADELASAMGTAPGRKRRSPARVAGRWKEDPEFDRALEKQRKIDWTLWK